MQCMYQVAYSVFILLINQRLAVLLFQLLIYSSLHTTNSY
jgi:hypothetical protein